MDFAEFQSEVEARGQELGLDIAWGSVNRNREPWIKAIVQTDDGLESEFVFREVGEFKGRKMLEVQFHGGDVEPVDALIEATPLAFVKLIR